LLPASAPTGGEDATDYSVGADDKVVVLPDETLGHYADWSKIPAGRLSALNKLRKNAQVTLGHKVKLDLSQVSAAQFLEARRAYHQRLQDAYFAGHRIAGTETYTVKRGDSLYAIAEQRPNLPLWLVVQYNPDLVSGGLRPGTSLTLPRVETINRE
jgi:membrane-bound lytic murein transglycosylase D